MQTTNPELISNLDCQHHRQLNSFPSGSNCCLENLIFRLISLYIFTEILVRCDSVFVGLLQKYFFFLIFIAPCIIWATKTYYEKFTGLFLRV